MTSTLIVPEERTKAAPVQRPQWWLPMSVSVWGLCVVGYLVVGFIVMNDMETASYVKVWWHDLPFVFVWVGVLAALSALAAYCWPVWTRQRPRT